MSKEVPQYDLDGLHGIITSSQGHHDLVYFSVLFYSKEGASLCMTRVYIDAFQLNHSLHSQAQQANQITKIVLQIWPPCMRGC